MILHHRLLISENLIQFVNLLAYHLAVSKNKINDMLSKGISDLIALKISRNSSSLPLFSNFCSTSGRHEIIYSVASFILSSRSTTSSCSTSSDCCIIGFILLSRIWEPIHHVITSETFSGRLLGTIGCFRV